MYECNSQSYTFLFSDYFANIVFWKSASGYFLAQWNLRCQRKYPHMKTTKNLSWKILGDVWIHLTELHLCFWSSPLTLSLGNLRRASLDGIEAYVDKGNFIRLNVKEAFWETALPCVKATHRVTRFSSVISLLAQFSGNLQLDTS